VAAAGAGALCQATLTLAPADSWSWEANTAAQAAVMQHGLMAAHMGRLGSSNPLAGGSGCMLSSLPSAATARQQQQQQQGLQQLSPARGGSGGMSPLPAISLQATLSLAHMPSGPLFSAAMAGLPEADMIPGLPDLSCFLDPGHASLA
jgi:hypothetical protein